jgi:hypothetical protein
MIEGVREHSVSAGLIDKQDFYVCALTIALDRD